MQLTEDAIRFARTHVRNYYDSDFFPKPVEFSALWSQWGKVADNLLNLDVKEVGSAPQILLAPKPKAGFRVVHQMQPVDTLIYTALAYMAAPQIEARRRAVGDEVVCSYRIEIAEPKGDFFVPTQDGYTLFHDRSQSLAESHGHVLLLDIADFYNQINLHRVENTLSVCCKATPGLSKAIEEFLMNLNLRGSRGIPVGPAASIVFSEASLIDLDSFLSTYSTAKIEYVRYADDFRVFSKSRVDLGTVLHDVTRYLYSEHRLALASDKTRLISSQRFLEEVLDPPNQIEAQKLHKRIGGLMDEVVEYYAGPDPEEDALERKESRWETASTEERQHLVGDLLEELLGRDVLDLGLARHLLRRARRARFRMLIPHVLESVDFFAPVFRDVALYLLHTESNSSVGRNLDLYEKMLATHQETVSTPFLRYWLSWLFATKSAYSESELIRDFIFHHGTPVRHQASFANRNELVGWLKNHKSGWQSLKAWDRRGVLLAADVLGETERKVWMDNVERVGDYLDGIVARHVRGL